MLSKWQPAFITILMTALIAGLAYWSLKATDADPARTLNTSTELVDFFATNAHIRQFQEDGSLKYDLKAPEFEHHQHSDRGFVTTPYLEIFQGAEIPWKITSTRAEIAPNGDQVELIENVKLEKTDSKARHTRITTERLTAFPDKEYAETAQAVRIEAAQGVTTGVGMKAYINEGRVLLLNNVRGQHEVR